MMKILGRCKLKNGPLHIHTGDQIYVTYKNEKEETILITHQISNSESMTVDEAVLFSDVFENRRALGGLLLEQKK